MGDRPSRSRLPADRALLAEHPFLGHAIFGALSFTKILVWGATSKGFQTVPSGFHTGVRSCLSTSSLPLGEGEAHGRPVPCSTRRNIPSSLWDNLVSFFHPGCPPLDKLQLFLCHSELTTTSSPLDKRLLQHSQGICTIGGRITLQNPDGMTAEASFRSSPQKLWSSLGPHSVPQSLDF